MTPAHLTVKILAAVLTFYFIFSEARYLTNISDAELYEMLLYDPDMLLINTLKYTLIFVALPILYFLKLFNFLWDRIFKTGGAYLSGKDAFFQAKIFYKTVYIIIFILIILRLIGHIF